MTMHFRKQSIADSVMERISAISDSVKTGAPLPTPRGAAVISLARQDNGDLMVTKTFDNGETELLTISSETPAGGAPAGVQEIATFDSAEQTTGAADPGGIVEGAALGGDSLDALLRT